MTDSVNNQGPPTKLQSAEFMLCMVVSFMLWSIGLVDLLSHTNANPKYQFLGPYTLSITIMLAGYAVLFFGWLALLLFPRSHLWIQSVIRNIQERLWLLMLTFGIFMGIGWSLFRVKEWANFPGLALAFFGLLILLTLVLLFTGWGSYGRGQRWRKLIAIPAGLLLLLEALTQGAAYAKLLPPMTINSGLYVPSGRIYQSEQGFANGRTNSNGWYFPEFRLDEGSDRIILMGDTFLQGLQVAPEENMGVHLDELVQEATQNDSVESEVLSMGMAGFGPGVYLSETRMLGTIERFDPKEIILLFHVANDFQLTTEPSGYELYHEIGEDGLVDIHEDSWSYRHDLQHLILHGYEQGLTPLRTLESHILLPKVLRNLFTANRSQPTEPQDPMDISTVAAVVTATRRVDSTHIDVTRYHMEERPGASNFLFEKTPGPAVAEPHAIALGLLRQANNFWGGEGVTLRIATIPAFPPAFFESDATDWRAELGTYDLFAPETLLADFAAEEGIDFLPMGHYMQSTGLSTAEISQLYFNNGQGHLTEAGHRYFAETIFSCLLSDNSPPECNP